MSKDKKILISIVSHAQAGLVSLLLNDLFKIDFSRCPNFLVVVTINTKEDESCLRPYLDRIVILRNKFSKGYGENNNYVFNKFKSDFFWVLNPDIRIKNNFDLYKLLVHVESLGGVIAPLVTDADGVLQDSAREFPTLNNLVSRFFLRKRMGYEIPNNRKGVLSVDWLAGMFMIFSSSSFFSIGGFSQKYYMYYEDVDICRRFAANNTNVSLCTSMEVIHSAQRASHKSPRHFYWHLRSMLVYFLTRY